MKKILYILNIAKKVNNFSYTSMIAAQKLGKEFHIAGNWSYSSDEERVSDEKQYGIKIHQIDFIRTPYHPGNWKAYIQLKELIQSENYDVIHCNTPVGGMLGRLVGKKCKVKKIIYQAHGFHFYKGAPKKNWLIYYPVEKLLSRYTDAVITINHEDYELAKNKLKLRHSGKVYYVPGVGIDLSKYNSDTAAKAEKRKELGLADDDIVLISAGNLNVNKNNKVVIEALAKLDNPKIHYIICGTGELQAELQKLADKLGLRDNIHFLGYRSDISELYRASDCFVMSSFREGLPRSIMEAMASALPCVVSKIRGNTDLIEDGVNGFLCEPTDAEGFADAIRKIADNSDLRYEMSKNNLEKIKEFDISVVEKEIANIYKEVLTGE